MLAVSVFFYERQYALHTAQKARPRVPAGIIFGERVCGVVEFWWGGAFAWRVVVVVCHQLV